LRCLRLGPFWRRVSRNDGLRELLIAERERSLHRWPPSRPDEHLADLRAGRPVVVSVATLMCVLMHAGLPHRKFAYGGADWSKAFLLDEHDRLSELSGL
jgi:hypothetical protein